MEQRYGEVDSLIVLIRYNLEQHGILWALVDIRQMRPQWVTQDRNQPWFDNG